MKTILIIVGLTALALIGFGIVHSITANNVTVVTPSSSVSVSGLTLTIAGEINRPGTYVLNEGATMIDLINAAGGATSNADNLAFNTDCVLSNKGSYYIAPVRDLNNTCSASPITKCNINSADVDTLMAVAGFSKSVSNAIINYRLSASFSCLEDIKLVSGIGSATYMSVRDKITLRDAA